MRSAAQSEGAKNRKSGFLESEYEVKCEEIFRESGVNQKQRIPEGRRGRRGVLLETERRMFEPLRYETLKTYDFRV